MCCLIEKVQSILQAIIISLQVNMDVGKKIKGKTKKKVNTGKLSYTDTSVIMQ